MTIWILEGCNDTRTQILATFSTPKVAQAYVARSYGILTFPNQASPAYYICRGSDVAKALQKARIPYTHLTLTPQKFITEQDFAEDNFDPIGTAIGDCHSAEEE